MAKGLMTNAELVDSLVEDINLGIKHVVTGNYVGWNAINVQMVQKLYNLKKGIESDLKSRDDAIEALKHQLRELGVEVVDIPAEKLIKDGDQIAEHH